MINIYCDESCHFENDLSNIMVLGSISCPKNKIRYINSKIREIKSKHDISRFNETKWIKVSNSKIQYYKDLISLFASEEYLQFRALVVTDKSKLRHADFNQDHNSFYYKMYYLLLKGKLLKAESYNIYLDFKDTQMNEKSLILVEYLRRVFNDRFNTIISKIQPIRSTEVEIMQLVDIMTGMTAYSNRDLNTSSAKLELLNYTEYILKSKFNEKSRLYDSKFNIFMWEPDFYEGRK